MNIPDLAQTYSIGLAAKFKLDPSRVKVTVRQVNVNGKSQSAFDVHVDGKDLSPEQEKIAADFFANELQTQMNVMRTR